MARLHEVVRQKRKARGWSQGELAKRINASQQSISKLEKGLVKGVPEYAPALLEALEIHPEEAEETSELLTSTLVTGPAGSTEAQLALQSRFGRPTATFSPAAVGSILNLPTDVPVHGTSVSGGPGDFRFTGEVIAHTKRPPGTLTMTDILSLFVAGQTMSPRFEDGDLVYAQKVRPPKIGDDVIVELLPEEGSEHGPCYIKRLVNRTSDRIICRQFNPPQDDEFPLDMVKAVHRIIPMNELLGI